MGGVHALSPFPCQPMYVAEEDSKCCIFKLESYYFGCAGAVWSCALQMLRSSRSGKPCVPQSARPSCHSNCSAWPAFGGSVGATGRNKHRWVPLPLARARSTPGPAPRSLARCAAGGVGRERLFPTCLGLPVKSRGP